MALEVISCLACGFEWQRKLRPGPKPRFCPECRQRPPAELTEHVLKVLRFCELRLAVEQATSALRLGRPAVALAALEAVPARARLESRPRR